MAMRNCEQRQFDWHYSNNWDGLLTLECPFCGNDSIDGLWTGVRAFLQLTGLDLTMGPVIKLMSAETDNGVFVGCYCTKCLHHSTFKLKNIGAIC